MTTNPTAADYQRVLDDIPVKTIFDYQHMAKWVLDNHNIIRSALTLAASDTHVWVPRELTQKMMVAMGIWFENPDKTQANKFIEKYKAMITAAEGKV